ncbi:LysR family transcriptional regulator [Sabulicella glaciei]|uniref:LysR family transcriptional regulator n=1 Tax=Sabulicella glaciei TaxID=2984948 RepID=A0ABT3NYX8_9PROT|nr:LysR family transcriptional regulator [Roseococcus sp. MDT2-1-1]MCW8087364.1 LysR family transcriptional regulator [Roseococcus sp. MDT2-1-1]
MAAQPDEELPNRRGGRQWGGLLPLLHHFDAAARHLNFTKAASELNVTQGAVSQRLRLLEGRLGIRLFRRLPRGLALTEEGAQLAAAVRRLLAELDDTVSRIQPRRRGPQLALGCPPSFAMLWLIPRIHDFSQAHPEVGIRFHGEFIGLAASGAAEAQGGLMIRYDPDMARHPGAEFLLPEYLIPVTAPLPSRGCPEPSAGLDRLHEATFLHDAAPWEGAPAFCEWREWIEGALPASARRRLGDAYRSGHQYNLAQLALRAASSGQGVAIGRSALVLEELAAKRLRVLKGAVPVRARAGYYVTHDGASSDARANFLTWLHGQCKDFEVARDLQLRRVR